MRISRCVAFLTVSLVLVGADVSQAASEGVADLAPPVAITRDLRDLGSASTDTPMAVTLMFGYRHEQELEALVESQANPESPLFHHFLTRGQFDAYFSPSASDYARANEVLHSSGLTTTGSPNRLMIYVRGTVGRMERFFGTDVHRVAQAGHGVRLINVSAAHAPPAFHGLAVAVIGFDGLVRFQTDLARGTPASVAPRPDTSIRFGPDNGYGPSAYVTAYGLPVTRTAGTGQSAAVVIDADFKDSDLKAFLKYFHVVHTGADPMRVLIDGGPKPGLSPDSGETSLDVETLSGIAPGLDLYVYEFPSFDNSRYIIDAYEQVVVDDKVGPVNSSFGGCELPGSPFSRMSEALALQGAALGITFHASTGDRGAFTCPSSVSVSAPASSPHFVAVGGTSLYENAFSGSVIEELAWPGSGGGVSSIFAEPAYQSKVTTAILGGRNIPDVSFDADPSTGASWYVGGQFIGPVGGTSLSSPIFGAGLALINAVNGSRAGFVNPILYKAFLAESNLPASERPFRDITFGSNGYYAAGPGYDDVTGIGAVLFANAPSSL